MRYFIKKCDRQKKSGATLGLTNENDNQLYKGNILKCAKDYQSIIEQLQNDPKISTIILSNRWSYYSKDRFEDENAHGRYITKLFDALLENRKKIIILHETPPVLNHYRCLNLRPIKFSEVLTEDKCSYTFKQVIELQKFYRNIFSNYNSPKNKLLFFDPIPLLCTKDYCPLFLNGEILNRDAAHITAYTSEYLAKQIINQYFK